MPPEELQQGKGCILEPLDAPLPHFDYEKARPQALGAVEIPKVYALEAKYVTNQAKIDACVGHAVAVQKSWQEGRQVSPRVIWGLTKKSEDYVGWGTYIHKALNVLAKIGTSNYGFLDESPFVTRDQYMKFEVTDELLSVSTQNKSSSFWHIAVGKYDLAREAVYKEGMPLITSLPWFESYNKHVKGVLPLPSGSSEGHAVDFLGNAILPDQQEYLTFQTSWSPTWGDKGKFYIPVNKAHLYGIGAFFISLDIPRDLAEAINKYGGKLIKTATSEKIYAVQGGLKRHIESELAFWLFSSESLQKGFETVSQEVIDLFNEGKPIKASDFDEKTLRVVRNMRDLYKANPTYAQKLFESV